MNRSRPTHNKRERERAKAEKQKQKAARRADAKVRKSSVGPRPAGEDPDIAGIVPGPQPSPWADEFNDVPEEDESNESNA